MKVFLCLFSLYILVLAGVPCQPGDDCCTGEIAANTAHTQPTQDHRDYPRPCSPFFACCDCHGFVIPEYNISQPESKPTQAIHNTLYKANLLPDFTSAIWQPPKQA